MILVEVAFEKFTNILIFHQKIHLSLIQKRFQNKNTSMVYSRRSRLKDAFIFQKSGKPELINHYKEAVNNLLVEETKASECIRNRKNSVRATWKLINSFRSSSGSKERQGGRSSTTALNTHDPSTFSNVFNCHFVNTPSMLS